MSVQWIAAVWEDESIQNRCDLLIMLALADFANKEGWCWPSMETVAEKARCSVRTVLETIEALCAEKRLLKVSRSGQNGTHRYKLLRRSSRSGCVAEEHAIQRGGNGGPTVGDLRINRHEPSEPSNRTPFTNVNGDQCLDKNNNGLDVQAQTGTGTRTDCTGGGGQADLPNLPQDDLGVGQHPPTPSPAAPSTHRARRRPKIGKPVVPTQELIALWCAAYEKRFSVPYLVSWGADGKAAKKVLLGMKKTPAEIMKAAVDAWNNESQFYCKQARTIKSFVSKFNEIIGELQQLGCGITPGVSLRQQLTDLDNRLTELRDTLPYASAETRQATNLSINKLQQQRDGIFGKLYPNSVVHV